MFNLDIICFNKNIRKEKKIMAKYVKMQVWNL